MTQNPANILSVKAYDISLPKIRRIDDELASPCMTAPSYLMGKYPTNHDSGQWRCRLPSAGEFHLLSNSSSRSTAASVSGSAEVGSVVFYRRGLAHAGVPNQSCISLANGATTSRDSGMCPRSPVSIIHVSRAALSRARASRCSDCWESARF